MVWKNLRKPSLLALILLFGVIGASAQTAPPTIFFTDLTSGPNTGGENNNGTILTIYGRNFGATRGTSSATVGGGAVAAYIAWGGRSTAATPAAQLETISVAIGAGAKTGTVVVNTAAGASSCADTKDSCQFTVRSGNIDCVATSGSSSNNGQFSSDPTARAGTKGCWATIVNAKNAVAAGDIAYIENGVTQTTIDDYAANLAISGNNCTSASPCALVVYPGAAVTIGNGTAMAIRTPAVSGVKDYWTIAGFKLLGWDALDLVGVTGWRVINNNLSCPTGSGESACMHTDTTTQYRFYANYTHNIGDQAGAIDKYFHANYFTTNSNHIWAAWNEVAPNPGHSKTQGGCRAIQFYSTGGANQFDLHVHDNWIHDAICDGLNFATIDPSQGTVEAYNNVIWHVGTGPDPYNGSSNYSCITSGGGGSGSLLAYNNTLYDCGSQGSSDSGALDPTGPSIAAYNNIVYQLSGEFYVNPNANSTPVSGSNNLWFGVGNGPSQVTGSINLNPLLKSVASDFTLLIGSPAIGAGTSAHASTLDFNGGGRPNPPSIGAYEFSTTTVVTQKPNPPTNLTVVVK